jgi:hypothetical protein
MPGIRKNKKIDKKFPSAEMAAILAATGAVPTGVAMKNAKRLADMQEAIKAEIGVRRLIKD